MKKPPDKISNPRRSSTWLGFATREPTNRGTVKIRIRWDKVALLLLFLGIFSWMGKSLALYYFFKDVRRFEEVSFMDMVVFPMNRSGVRVQQGNYQIEQAKSALEREDYRRAFGLLREGLVRAPANTEGRILLAQLYSGWRPDLAIEVLENGLDDGKDNSEFVQLLFALLLANKEDNSVLEISEGLLSESLPEEIIRTARVARLQSAMLRGRFDITKEVFSESDVENSLDGVLIGTQLYQRSGRADTARNVLEAIIDSKPKGDLGPLYFQLVNILRDEGLEDLAREMALEYVIHDPLTWRPRVLLIDVLFSNDLLERRDQEIEALMLQHRGNEQAMAALAQVCGQHGNVRAATKLYEVALENGFNLGKFILILVEANIRDGQYDKAIGLCNELAREDPGWLVTEESTFNAIRSLAYYMSGDSELGSLYLRDFLESRRIGESTLYQAAFSMNQYGFPEQALLILERAYAVNPRNESVLSLMISVEMDLGAYFSISEHLTSLFAQRRPEYTLMEDIHKRLQSDRFLFTENRGYLLQQLREIIAEQEAMDWDIWEPYNEQAS